MYLLSTELLTRLVRGADQKLAQFIENKQGSQIPIFAAVPSFAILHWDISAIGDAVQKNIWQTRYDIASNKFDRDGLIAEISYNAVKYWSILSAVNLTDTAGRDIGDMERLVIATAAARNWRLLLHKPGLDAQLVNIINLETEIVG